LQIPIAGVAVEDEEMENKFLKSISASNYFNAAPKLMIIIEIVFTIGLVITLSLKIRTLEINWLYYEFVFVSCFLLCCYTIIYLKLRYRHTLTLHRFWQELSTSDITSLRRANFQTLIYFAYICQFIVISIFFQFFTYYMINQEGPNDIRTLDLVTILIYYPSNFVMLLGMAKSIKRAMRTLARQKHISRKLSVSYPLTNNLLAEDRNHNQNLANSAEIIYLHNKLSKRISKI